MRTPKITITFPVIGKDKMLSSCLESIKTLSYPQEKLEVILVDNGLDPSLKKKAKKKFPKVSWLSEGKNLGFAAAVNLGAKKAKGEWILVTNSDVVFDSKCLFELVKVGNSSPWFGILGPRVYCLPKKSEISDQDMPGFGTDFFWGRPRSLSVGKLARLKKPIEVNWVSGSGMMIKKRVIDKVGLLDERFFAYWEDADFGTRAKRAGFKAVLVPQAKLYHQGSVIMGKTSPEKIYYLARNGRLFLSRYASPAGKVKLHLENLLVLLVKGAKGTFGINREENLAIVAGIFDYYQGRFGKRKK